MFYAVKSVDYNELNMVYDNWADCKSVIEGSKVSVFKAFDTDAEAYLFLKTTSAYAVAPEESHIPDYVGEKSFDVKFVSSIFQSNDGYSVGKYEMEEKRKITCSGYNLPTSKNTVYAFYGKFEKHKKYGWQFIVSSYEENFTDTKDSIIAYLSCGIIKGIGKRKAADIYALFGDKTMEVFDKNPEKLLMVPGIRKKTYDKIIASYKENRGARKLAQYLISFDISQRHALPLYKNYGAEALSKIKENPYLLCYLRGVTFEDADRVAKAENHPLDSDMRFFACACHVLLKNELTGDTGMELNHFGYEVWKTLNGYSISSQDDSTSAVNKATVNAKTISLIRAKKLHLIPFNGEKLIFSDSAYKRETSIADNVLRLRSAENTYIKSYKEIDRAVKMAESEISIQLDSLQESAVYIALQKPMSIICGGPGTGKTTVLRVLNEAYRILHPENNRIFLAPTGRAKRKIIESTNEPAHTLHSYLHIFKDVFSVEDDVIIENSLVVIDEFSMADVKVSEKLFRCIQKNCHVVIVGDIHQLESVGPGAVMRDLYSTKLIPMFELTHIYRQDENAQIAQNAKKINEGCTDIVNGSDFTFYECSVMEHVKQQMVREYVKYVNTYGLLNVMCICPFKDHTAGVRDMNEALQNAINPADDSKNDCTIRGITFRNGDPVMHVSQNTESASNGDIGVILSIYHDEDDGGLCIDVDINEHILTYKGEDLDSLSLAYAITVHKAQGSEADAVVTCLTSFHEVMLCRNIPYVAITRGKKQVSMIGERNALNTAIKNINKRRRKTLLNYKLQLYAGDYVAV